MLPKWRNLVTLLVSEIRLKDYILCTFKSLIELLQLKLNRPFKFTILLSRCHTILESLDYCIPTMAVLTA